MSDELAERLIALLSERGLTIAVAESLTGGLVVAELVAIPGASAVVRGGVVAYATDLKATLLGVDADVLAAGGAIQSIVAEQMAEGVRQKLGADVGVATTGVAGPDPQDGHPPGEVWIAVARAAGSEVERLTLAGGREAVRRQTVERTLQFALEVVAE